MFSTKPTLSLRNLFARYHEPAGLTAQQSQKLLDGLKSSFRLQLEQEYGQTALTKQQRHPRSRSRSPANEQAVVRHSAASRHLRSILANPIFSYNTNNRDPSSPLTPVSIPRRDPMDDFDHAVAKGLMTLNAATGCMITKQRLLDSSEVDTGPASESATALRVVRWLRSTGAENDLAFLEHQAFVKALAPFLIAENMEEIAWQWISRTMQQQTKDTASDDVRLRRASFLLSQLVHIKSQPQHGDLDGAITTILRAEQVLAQDPLLSRLLVLPWRSVSWLSTVESYSHLAPSEKLFDAHLHTADRLKQSLSVETAHLHLYHPTHPDPAPAMRFFQDKQQLRKLVRGLTREKMVHYKQKSLNVVPWVAYLGYDTVNHLTTSGLAHEAQSLTQILQEELSILFTPREQLS
ncbi:hypothetical protein PWT90_06848 [Aphanocladium album]|nr:hypothetical protein PWT90_06848 [Aphanocladium album]